MIEGVRRGRVCLLGMGGRREGKGQCELAGRRSYKGEGNKDAWGWEGRRGNRYGLGKVIDY